MEKQKVDVAAIIQKAKNKTESVKNSTEKIQGTVSCFKLIPDFSNYEFNGVIVRNSKTKSIISMIDDEYHLKSDIGAECEFTKNQIIKLFPAVEEKIIPAEFKTVDVLMGEEKSKLFRVNLLHHQGISREEIISKLGISNREYTNSQWFYLNKGYKEKVEKYLSKINSIN